jgi:ppGpp synthetase/RelA/SpoT-type nucleotidyltranferase
MTLSQMQDIGGCRAIVATAVQVDQLCANYAESDIKHALHRDIKHALHRKDNYIATPKDSGYRGVHLV